MPTDSLPQPTAESGASFCSAFLTEPEQEKLDAFFLEGAKRIESWPEHWVYGADDQSLSYCRECCQKEVDRQKAANPSGDFGIDGGWGSESDSTPFCETCGKLLDATLTDYGCESEIQHFETYGFSVESDDDRRSMHEVILSITWEPYNDQRGIKERLHKLGRSILEKL